MCKAICPSSYKGGGGGAYKYSLFNSINRSLTCSFPLFWGFLVDIEYPRYIQLHGVEIVPDQGPQLELTRVSRLHQLQEIHHITIIILSVQIWRIVTYLNHCFGVGNFPAYIHDDVITMKDNWQVRVNVGTTWIGITVFHIQVTFIFLSHNIEGGFRGMHVFPAKHSYVWLPRKCDFRTDRRRTKWSLCAAMLRSRHKCDYRTDTQTDAAQSDPYVSLCFAGDTSATTGQTHRRTDRRRTNRICYLCLTVIDLSQSRVVCCNKSQSRL